MSLRNEEESLEINIPNYWMITYSDMVTIILCFFIIFFTLSAKENSLLYEIKTSLKITVDNLKNENEILEEKNISLQQKNKKLQDEKKTLAEKLFKLKNINQDVNTSSEDFIKYLRDNNLLNEVYIIQNEEGLLIRFKDSVLFDSGLSKLKEDGFIVLDKISDKLKDIDNQIRVEGFTDNIPIKTSKYNSNWELSAARAISVVRYFIENKGIDENRLSFTGWGEYKPIANNNSPEGRAKNRRIEITILKQAN